MLFRKKQTKSCQYCSYSTSVQDGQVLCSRHGIRSQESPCRSFRYDPCKRIPPKKAALDFSSFTKEDFSL